MALIDDIQLRQDYVIEFMKLGMDYHTACVASEVPADVEDEWRDDEAFSARVNYEIARTEGELLKRLRQAADKQAASGNSKATERLLEILRPEKYSKTTKLAHSFGGQGGEGVGGITVNFVGAPTPSEEDDLTDSPQFLAKVN